MQLFTTDELETLRRRLDEGTAPEAFSPEILYRLVRQAGYALEAKAVLREFEHYPAEPYTPAADMVAGITSAANDLWNKYKY